MSARLRFSHDKIVEIVPENMPEWAWDAFDDGQFFNVCVDKITRMEDFLRHLHMALQVAHRMGENVDDPEGVRYIQISDTLAREWVERIEGLLEDS